MNEVFEMAIAKESEQSSMISRKEKRKEAKKEKRKQKRKEEAEKERQEEDVRLNDPEEQRRIQLEEEREKERLERERREFEERERLFLEALAARKKAQEEEEARRRAEEEEEEQKLKENQAGCCTEANEDNEWEYAEEGPPEIIWEGNEIIVKKNKVRVKKKTPDQHRALEDPNRPTSNPLVPQSEAFADYKGTLMTSAQQLLENVAQQTPNFGTEQDKAHCPFHLKTGACRFGLRCSRVHFYPDKSCTLLIKNMYNGPGLAWEQDEGLEFTEEEVEHSYEEFYEDVHTEFLKFGEIVNFKVCRNGSYHLRGNVYVHYKSLDSAVLAYHSINGRYFAGKQVSCEFIGVTRWKVAICGEYMKSKLKTCSRGTACNFIHCFRNPGGDYEWADWDRPPPRFWREKMAALFGYSDESGYDKWIEEETPLLHRISSRRSASDRERYSCRRSQSNEIECSNRSSGEHYEEDSDRTTYRQLHKSDDAKRKEVIDSKICHDETHHRSHQHGKKRPYDDESDRDWFNMDKDADGLCDSTRKCSRHYRNIRLDSYDHRKTCTSGINDTVNGTDLSHRGRERHKRQEHMEKSSRQREVSSGIVDNVDHGKRRSDSINSCREWSYEEGDSVSSEDNLYRRKTYDSDSTSNCCDGIIEKRHMHRRKSSRHVNEVSGSSYVQRESRKDLGVEYQWKESECLKSNATVPEHINSGRKDYYSKNSEVKFPDEHLKSHEVNRHIDTNLHDHRSKSFDSDLNYGHKRKSNSDEKFNTGIPAQVDEDIDRRGRWEPLKIDSGEYKKHGRKSDSNDPKPLTVESGIQNLSSDGYSKESRSRDADNSSHRKQKITSREMEYKEKIKEFDNDGDTHEGKYRRQGHKKHGKKTSS